ncbi:MAG: cytochrome c [Deltaproteobacteria bacterium]|nr:cytochrome c [Deltaproteobacteria bacterium]
MFRLLLLIVLLAACGDDEPRPEPTPIGPPAGSTDLEWGEQLFQSQGCFACHRIDGGPSVGPALNGVAGESRTLPDGRTVVVDADYLREALTEPEAVRVPGYEGTVMPTYELAPAQLDALIGYLQSLSVMAR